MRNKILSFDLTDATIVGHNQIMKRIQKRQSIFQINVEVCERQKTMEKVLSNEIDENLRVLRLFYPFNDALQAVFVKVCR